MMILAWHSRIPLKLRAGAEVVDCVLNGYSHRSGNCALDQIVLALEALYDIRTGVDVSQLMSLCVRLGGFRSSIPTGPILARPPTLYGGVHIGALQEGWFIWETIRAEAIGQQGMLSGHRQRLNATGWLVRWR
jgi:isopropylmalate/homocitrate/citramalate synthase